MSKITRYNGNVVPFANNAQAGERFVFGSSTEQSNDLTALVSANYLRGWGVVGPSDFPPLEWFNAQAFTHGQFISYLHQMGVPEWNAAQEYPTEGAQVVHNLSLWTRGPGWVLGDEPGVAGSTRWAKGINASDLGTAAAADLGTGATEVPTNADVDTRVAPIETDVLANSSDITELSTANNARTKAALNATGDAPIYACRAWANIDMTGATSIRASGNVIGVVDNVVGDMTIIFATAMPDANYSVNCLAKSSTGSSTLTCAIARDFIPLAGSVRITTQENVSGASTDADVLTISVFR